MHTEHIFRKYKLLKFEDIKLINDISIAHSIVHGYASQITQQDIKKVQPHERNCRNLFNLEIDNLKKINHQAHHPKKLEQFTSIT